MRRWSLWDLGALLAFAVAALGALGEHLGWWHTLGEVLVWGHGRGPRLGVQWRDRPQRPRDCAGTWPGSPTSSPRSGWCLNGSLGTSARNRMTMDTRLTVLTWMAALNLIGTLAVLLKLCLG